ncbi:MAG: hypothetical protein HYX35_02200 [Proteobacteria bacterium]|nr:hypothetical protein [Pseudomonadota bacterium]
MAADGEVTMKIQWPGQGPYPFENIWWVAAKDIPAPDDKGMETLAYLNTLKYSLACTDTHPDTAEPSCDLTVTRE